MSDLLPDKIFYQHRTEPFNLPSYDAPPGGLDTVEYVRSDLVEGLHEEERCGPVTRCQVPGGWVYYNAIGGMCFVPHPTASTEQKG